MTRTSEARPHMDRQEAAGEWLLRLEADDLDQQELAAWLEWYTHPANRATFDELQAEYERLRSASPSVRQKLADKVLTANAVSASSSSQRAARLRWLAAAGVAAIAACAALWVWRTHAWPSRLQTAAYHTPRAEHDEIDLPDDSVVQLGASSSVSLSYTTAARYVVLEQGEAFFDVAPDPRRPFIVQAGTVAVRAIGTQFNVRRTEDRVVVTVSEGAVDVARDQSAKRIRVAAGEQAKIDAQREELAVTRTDPAMATAWQSGRLEFVNEPLSAVVATVNRYSSREIVLGNGAGDISYTGTVFEDRIDEWLRALQDVFPLQLTEVDGQTVVLSTPK
jgi:transmembrane sensor